MRRMCSVLAMAALVAWPAFVSAQDEYTIKLKKSTAGAKTHEEKVLVEASDTKVSDTNGNELQTDKKSATVTSTFTQTVLARPDASKKPTSLKRVYEKATVKDEDGDKVLPYQGKTVLIEKKGAKYAFHYDHGGEITGDDAKWLDKEFNSRTEESDIDLEAMMLPKTAVKVGGTWKIDMAPYLKDLEKDGKMKAIGDKATGSGKLLKAYKKDGRQFGDFEVKMEIPLKSVREKDMEIVLEKGAILILDAKASACIDGSSEDAKGVVSWTFTGTTLVPADNPMARVDIVMRGTEQSISVDLISKK